jgi:hypothetical protein
MQEANLKRLQLDLIVNRHIDEINKFNRQSENKLIKLIAVKRDLNMQNIENIFQEFYEIIGSNNLVYNNENKIIKIKFNKNELEKNFYDKIIQQNININNNFYNNNNSINNNISLDFNSNLIDISPAGILIYLYLFILILIYLHLY